MLCVWFNKSKNLTVTVDEFIDTNFDECALLVRETVLKSLKDEDESWENVSDDLLEAVGSGPFGASALLSPTL